MCSRGRKRKGARRYEAVTHYGNALKLLINEKFGDGIMSAIDFYVAGGAGTKTARCLQDVLRRAGMFLKSSAKFAEANPTRWLVPAQMTVGKTVGKQGENSVVVTFNGKFLPHIEQNVADNTCATPDPK